MLKNITIGQYFPGSSYIHMLDPRTKILITIGYMIIIFLINNIIGYLIQFFIIYLFYILSKIPVKMIIKSLKPILPIIILTSILNIFLVDGNVLLSFYIFKITDRGIEVAIFMIFRIICLISVSSLLTYTTSPIVLTNGIESLLSPLKRVKFPVHELSMTMTIAIRFIPTLLDETDKIIISQKSRGAQLDTGGIIKRSKALIPVIIPLFISSFRRAEELALAMESRCYNGGEGRTKLKQLKYTKKDFFAYIFVLLNIAIVLLINIIVN